MVVPSSGAAGSHGRAGAEAESASPAPTPGWLARDRSSSTTSAPCCRGWRAMQNGAIICPASARSPPAPRERKDKKLGTALTSTKAGAGLWDVRSVYICHKARTVPRARAAGFQLSTALPAHCFLTPQLT